VVRGRCDCRRVIRDIYNIAVLKIEEGAMSQGMWAASRIWKKAKK